MTGTQATIETNDTRSSADPEAMLLAQLRAGDAQAFERLVRQHGPRMLAVARRLLRCEQDCNDAVQEAFIAAFQALPRFSGESSLGTWLHRIVVNACLMHLRRRRREVPLDPLLPSFRADGHHAQPIPQWPDSACADAARHEWRDIVRACIMQLPESYRTVLLLRDIEEISTDEAAAALGITPNNVKTRLHRARQALRQLLQGQFSINALSDIT